MRKRVILVASLFLFAGFLVWAGGQTEKNAPASDTGKTTIVWWDHYLPLVPLHQKIWDKYMADHPNVDIQYTQYDPNKLSEALQLANRSNQMPDVFPDVLGVPVSSLYHEGWFSPMDISIKDIDPAIAKNLFEGYSIFDGKVYSFPTFSNLNHPAITWYNKDLIKAAGYTEATVPTDYAGLRELAKKVTQQSGGKAYGIILPLKFTSRMQTTIDDLAMAAGGPGPIDWHTGKYTYDSKYYQDVFNFIIGLSNDGSVDPASSSLDMRQARERWATGEAALLLDGSWNIGVVDQNFKSFEDKVAVTSVPVPKTGVPFSINRGPAAGTFWISGQSKHPDVATDILKRFMTDDYFVGLAERMDQPPLKLSAVAKADVHPTYKKVIGYFQDEMHYAPDPLLKNPAAAKVNTEMKEIHPNPAEILQGVFAGAVSDYKAALRKYNDAMNAERERAIKAVDAAGANVSITDWVFPNWKSGVDYSRDMYK